MADNNRIKRIEDVIDKVYIDLASQVNDLYNGYAPQRSVSLSDYYGILREGAWITIEVFMMRDEFTEEECREVSAYFKQMMNRGYEKFLEKWL